MESKRHLRIYDHQRPLRPPRPAPRPACRVLDAREQNVEARNSVAEHGRARSDNIHKIMDVERRLALALEAYGETIRKGDLTRASSAVPKLEIGYGESRRRKTRKDNQDPIRAGEIDRYVRRKLVRMCRQAERMTAEKASGRKLNDLKREIKAIENLLR